MNEEKYKEKVKSKVKTAAFAHLLQLKNSHSKMDNVTYDKLEIQEYLKSPIFNDESARVLLALRTRTIRGIKYDFRGMHSDVVCPLGCGNNDTLPNMLTCSVLQCKSVQTKSAM